MNLLAAVVPGVRELRTPLVVGALWAAVITLLVAPGWDSTVAKNHGLGEIQRTLADLPGASRAAAFGVGLYLLGCIAVEVEQAAGRIARSCARLFFDWVPVEGIKTRSKLGWIKRSVFAARIALLPTPPLVKSAVLDAAASAFARAGAPGGTFLAVPVDILAEQAPAAARQMWESAPQQAQEYDRLSAEGQFRAAVVPPICGLAAICATKASAWLWFALPLISVLLYQAYRSRRNADEVLIAAMYLGYVKLPSLESLSQELGGMGLPADEPTWMAASVVAAHRLGDFDVAEGILEDAPDMLAPGRDDDEERLDAFAQALDDLGGHEYAELYRRRRAGYYDTPLEERLADLDLN